MVTTHVLAASTGPHASYRRRSSRSPRATSLSTATRANFIIAAYVVLWGFEGAVRRWVPGVDQAAPLLRDTLLVGALTFFFVSGRPRRANRLWTVLWTFAAVAGTLAALNIVRGHTTLSATALGLRSYLVPVLLTVFAVTYADHRLLDKLRAILAAVALANLPVVLLQVTSSPDSVFNREINGAEAYFVNAGDVARASGTFAAPSGLSIFLPIALAVMLGSISDGVRRRPFFAMAALACGVMGAVSGSRSSLLGLAIVLVAFALITLAQARWRSFVTLALGIGGSLAAWQAVVRFAPEVIASFETRIDQAAQSEDAADRLLNATFGFLTSDFPVMGDGVGSRSASGYLLSGQPWVEIEFLRWTHELGVVGYALAVASLAAGAVCAIYVLLHLRRRRATRLMILWQLAAMLVIGAATQQPTAQGAFGLIFVLAWLSALEDEELSAVTGPTTTRSAEAPARNRHSSLTRVSTRAR